MMKTISRDRRQQSQNGHPSARGVGSVTSDLDKLLAPKSLEELDKLEKQIKAKLSSDEPVDTDYWEHLLKSLLTYKARAKLRQVSQSIVEARVDGLRKQQAAEASALELRLRARLPEGQTESTSASGIDVNGEDSHEDERHALDPEPLLRLRPEDKALESISGAEFARALTEDRRKVLRLGYIPNRKRTGELGGKGEEHALKRLRIGGESGVVQASTSLFDREVARGLNDNEEIFTAEEEVETKNKSEWAQKYRPRKPKYFSRVIKGYEWNKYNQTHYDHENPPPKVIQGYKFNLFYPDLVPDSVHGRAAL